MNVPAPGPSWPWYRFNATWPLALLSLGVDEVSLQVRGSNVGIHVGVREVTTAYRLKGELFWSGVGLDLSDGRVLYFWTWRDKYRVLDALRNRGIPIDGGTWRANPIWLFRHRP